MTYIRYGISRVRLGCILCRSRFERGFRRYIYCQFMKEYRMSWQMCGGFPHTHKTGNPITMPLVCHHYRTEVGVAVNLNCYFCFNIMHFPCNYIIFMKVQYSIFIHSVYTTHQISDSKTFHTWRKIKIQMVGHNITSCNFILYLILF